MPPVDGINEEANNTPIQNVAIAIIQQAIDLVNTLHDDQYTYPSKVMPAGTIGKHIR
jgi:hypothetical protein